MNDRNKDVMHFIVIERLYIETAQHGSVDQSSKFLTPLPSTHSKNQGP
jgi:hypothetical protein